MMEPNKTITLYDYLFYKYMEVPSTIKDTFLRIHSVAEMKQINMRHMFSETVDGNVGDVFETSNGRYLWIGAERVYGSVDGKSWEPL
jgi:hypothetical protein